MSFWAYLAIYIGIGLLAWKPICMFIWWSENHNPFERKNAAIFGTIWTVLWPVFLFAFCVIAVWSALATLCDHLKPRQFWNRTLLDFLLPLPKARK